MILIFRRESRQNSAKLIHQKWENDEEKYRPIHVILSTVSIHFSGWGFILIIRGHHYSFNLFLCNIYLVVPKCINALLINDEFNYEPINQTTLKWIATV